MYRVRTIQKKGNFGKDGRAPIYIEYAFDRNKKALFNTGKRVEPEHWNPNKREVRKTHPDYRRINSTIKDLSREIEAIADAAIHNSEVPTINYVKEQLGKGGPLGLKRGISVENALDQWIKSVEKKSAYNTVRGYKTFRNHLLTYLKIRVHSYTLSDLSSKMYDDFLNYLETEVELNNGEMGLMESAAGKQIKNLKVFLKYCFKQEWIRPFDLSEFKVKSGTSDHVYMAEEELDLLLETDFSMTPHLQRTRDWFVIGCETGLRFSDFSQLKRQHIQGQFIRKPTLKTGKKVIIPISDRLQRVLDFYNNDFPESMNNTVFNRQIKDVCRIAGIDTPFSKIVRRAGNKTEETVPKYAAVASHTCRRSFCTNQFLKGMPTLLIRKISGHNTERAFLRYIKIDEEQAAEEMARRWTALND